MVLRLMRRRDENRHLEPIALMEHHRQVSVQLEKNPNSLWERRGARKTICSHLKSCYVKRGIQLSVIVQGNEFPWLKLTVRFLFFIENAF